MAAASARCCAQCRRQRQAHCLQGFLAIAALTHIDVQHIDVASFACRPTNASTMRPCLRVFALDPYGCAGSAGACPY